MLLSLCKKACCFDAHDFDISFSCNRRWRCTVTPTGSLLWYTFCLSRYRKSLMHTACAVLVYYVSALLLIGMRCTSTLQDFLQIFKAKIWSICISAIREVRRLRLRLGNCAVGLPPGQSQRCKKIGYYGQMGTQLTICGKCRTKILRLDLLSGGLVQEVSLREALRLHQARRLGIICSAGMHWC